MADKREKYADASLAHQIRVEEKEGVPKTKWWKHYVYALKPGLASAFLPDGTEIKFDADGKAEITREQMEHLGDRKRFLLKTVEVEG